MEVRSFTVYPFLR